MKEEYNVADLSKVIAYAESILGNDYTGHGFDHVKRVAGLSQAIIDADELAVDCFVVQAISMIRWMTKLWRMSQRRLMKCELV